MIVLASKKKNGSPVRKKGRKKQFRYLKDIAPRTTNFLWDSKEALYTYFEKDFGIGKAIVDQEIDYSREFFRLRKGGFIDTRELWQKVGSSLSRQYKKHGSSVQKKGE